MSRLALAWALVALWFAAASWLVEQRPGAGQTALRVARCAAEALVATLLASLWFDSLGHGGWWVLFALLGLVAGLPARLRETPPGAAAAGRMVWFLIADAVRYVAAGALLAWRLG